MRQKVNADLRVVDLELLALLDPAHAHVVRVLTGEEQYARWHERVHQWAYAHFPDPVHGEWFGYLHRDGTVSTRLKGNLWKGPFHLPRMQWFCTQRIEEMLQQGAV